MKISILAIIGAVLVPVVAFFGTAAVMSIPPDTHGIDIVEGRDLFRAHCGACHFAKEGFPAHHGPNLYQIGKTGATRRPDVTAAEYILESILDPAAFIAPSSRPGMPKNLVMELPPEKIRNIVGFLASCGAFPDYEKIHALVIPDRRTSGTESVVVSRENMELATQVLAGKGTCLECHSVYNVPEDRFHAPGIFGVGLADDAEVRKSIVEPYRDIKGNYGTVQIALVSGEVVSGRLIEQSNERIVISRRDENGQLATQAIAMDEIEDDEGKPAIYSTNMSLMPDGLAKTLSPAELEAILLLIHQLN